MVNKYNNPRLFNTVLTGPGMNHPRNPHVVIGSDTKGFIQGDMMDANAVMETIDQKIDVDNLIDDNKLTTAVNNAVASILGGVSMDLDTLKKLADTLQYQHMPDTWDASTQDSFIRSIINDSSAISGKKYLAYTEDDFTSEERLEILTGPEDFGATGPGRSLFIEIMDTTGDIAEDSLYVSERIKFTYTDDNGQVYTGYPMIDYEGEDEHEVFYIQWETALNLGDRTKLDAIEYNAEVNLNAFSTVTVYDHGTLTNLVADRKTDNFTISAGDNITFVANALNDAFSISVKEPKSDYNQYDYTKFDYIENRPLKLSDLFDDINYESPNLGDYLYSDYTWGTNPTGAIGVCVGTPEMFKDHYARFVPADSDFLGALVVVNGSSMYLLMVMKWSNVNENINNISDEDGEANTIEIISHVTSDNLYSSASFCRSCFGGRGYLPTIKELRIAWPTLKTIGYRYPVGLAGTAINFDSNTTKVQTSECKDDENIYSVIPTKSTTYSNYFNETYYMQQYKTGTSGWVIPFVKVAPVRKN